MKGSDNLKESHELLKEFLREKLPDMLDKLRKPDGLKGKVLCFVPQWEKSYYNNALRPNDNQTEYSLEEGKFIKLASLGQSTFGEMAFIAYKETEYSEIKFFPYNKSFSGKMEKGEFYSHYFLNLIIIDYDLLEDSFLEIFLNYNIGNKNKNKNKICPLFSDSLEGLMKLVSSDNISYSHGMILEFLNKYYSGTLELKDWGKIDFLGKYYNEKILVSDEEIKATSEGYLWFGNRVVGDFINSRKEEDIKVFQSVESLLFYELKEVFLKSRRCLYCGNVLPEPYKGKYCPDNKECSKERGRFRQRKFIKNSKK